jgi:hypothetical protein
LISFFISVPYLASLKLRSILGGSRLAGEAWGFKGGLMGVLTVEGGALEAWTAAAWAAAA